MVPLAHHGRPHQSLRPHLAALLRLRFQAVFVDGLGTDWPVTYDEMSPWYDKAEGFIGVTGTKEGIRTRAGREFPAADRAARARNADPESVRPG